ncbi:hypothetical protein DFH08DRAFT_1089662 [Mycena albidolilacea]|uniref:Uncharacterized protein n=1 Tax=Mycena albidolilacea TaxID=1033008 RepID=A0AAD6Z0A5_9AGAR|nr:hypothetical protein DFH08DRAFT_1089662 [Mycena albidolilacea]
MHLCCICPCTGNKRATHGTRPTATTTTVEAHGDTCISLWAPSLSISITVHVVEQSQKQARRDCIHQRAVVLTDYFGASRTLAHAQLYSHLTWAEWTARDEWVCSTIALNIVDIIELGLKDTGTAKELWDSIIQEYRNKSTMTVSHVQDNIGQEMYNPVNLIDDHFERHNVLCRAVIDTEATISDDEYITNLIKYLPASLNYIKPTLYTLTTIGDLESLLT